LRKAVTKKKFHDLRKYWPNLTLKEAAAERQKIFDRQEGKCAICLKPESHFSKKLAVDHRHSDGLVRGLLCFRDNKFLVGRFTLKTILPVVAYLVQHEMKGELCQIYGEMLKAMKEDIK
jgi:hypothetical protein